MVLMVAVVSLMPAFEAAVVVVGLVVVVVVEELLLQAAMVAPAIRVAPMRASLRMHMVQPFD